MASTTATQVWIDQDLCTGDGICTEIAPAVFEMDDRGLACVVVGGVMLPDGLSGVAAVPDEELEAVVEAAEECPGECIFVEANSEAKP